MERESHPVFGTDYQTVQAQQLEPGDYIITKPGSSIGQCAEIDSIRLRSDGRLRIYGFTEVGIPIKITAHRTQKFARVRL